ncbi:MAG: N-acetylmuramoyl-L-alanine amidase [Clostridia bacterium]|nr:N-acetylmuramoyl-L-alanine amidase [Clostridia bacterium]
MKIHYTRFLRRVVLFLLLSVLLTMAALTAFPASAYSAGGKIVVMLDPGHSEGDGGGTYAAKHLECWYNMKVALACKAALEKNGNFDVYLSHPDNNTAATLLERAQAANAVNADVIISMHFDGGEMAGMNGAEVLTSVIPKFSLETLAGKIMNQLTTKTELAWRGVFQRADTGDGVNLYYWNAEKQWDIPGDRKAGPLSDYYGIITWGAKYGIPALIIEHGFMTNEHDRIIAENEENLRKMGEADAAAIIDYYTGHTHKWTSYRQTDYPTNCCFAGKASYHCTVCGARKGTVSLAAPTENDHYYVVTAHKDKTCTENGYTTYTCRIAANLTDKGYNVGQHTYTTTEYAWGHQYKVTEDREVTHTVDGVHTEVCSVCGDTVSEVTKAEGHTWEFVSEMEPTCEEEGGDLYRCSVCGEERLDAVPALGHHYEVTVDTKPDCTKDGVHTEVCSVCGDTQELIFPMLGHTMRQTGYEEPVCEQDGVIITACQTCGHEEREVLPMLSHSWSLPKTILEPDFFRTGEELYTCLNDPTHTRTEILPRGAKMWQLVLIGVGCIVLVIADIICGIFLIVRHRRKKNEPAEEETIAEASPTPEESSGEETVSLETAPDEAVLPVIPPDEPTEEEPTTEDSPAAPETTEVKEEYSLEDLFDTKREVPADTEESFDLADIFEIEDAEDSR